MENNLLGTMPHSELIFCKSFIDLHLLKVEFEIYLLVSVLAYR